MSCAVAGVAVARSSAMAAVIFIFLSPAAIVAAGEGSGQVCMCNPSSLRAKRSEAMTERSNLLRRHFVGTAAGLVDVVATGVVGNFGGLAGRVFERGRLHRRSEEQ